MRVLGAKDDRPSDLPRVRIDDGLVTDLMEWMRGQQIHPRVPGGETGGGRYIAFHYPENAGRICEWLKTHGVLGDPDGESPRPEVVYCVESISMDDSGGGVLRVLSSFKDAVAYVREASAGRGNRKWNASKLLASECPSNTPVEWGWGRRWSYWYSNMDGYEIKEMTVR